MWWFIGFILLVGLMLVCGGFDAIMNYCIKPIKKEEVVIEEKVEAIPVLNISEPVISFIELVRANPRRFKWKQEYYISLHGTGNSGTTYRLHDKLENITYSLTRRFSSISCNWWYTPSLSWLTNDECNFIYDEISKIYNERYEARKLRHKNSGRLHFAKRYGIELGESN